MSQSLSQIYLHLIRSTKERKTYLKDCELRHHLHRYLAGVCEGLHSPVIASGGVEDHIHILCRQAKTISVADLVRDIKRATSKWIKAECPKLAMFAWQAGYGAFSISPGHVKALTQYIETQEEHHRKVTFQDEFRRICKRYSVEIDERYCWT